MPTAASPLWSTTGTGWGSTATTGRFRSRIRARPPRGARMPPQDAARTRGGRTVTPALLRGWALPPPGSDKNARGSVLVVGGAARTPGAVMLAGLAALRAGAGKLQMAVAEPAAVPLAIAVPAAPAARLPAAPVSGSVEGAAADVVRDLAARADVVCLGPGLDDAERTNA